MKRLLLAAALLAATPAFAVNLITNGDFESGNTGFSSDYVYAPSSPSAGTPESTYLIDTNAANVHPAWFSFADHTSGSGNYLIENGATSTIDGANKVAWQQTITAAANTTYFFEAFASNLCCNASYQGLPAPSNLTFTVDDGTTITTLGTFTTDPANPGVWTGLSNSFTTGTNTLLTLRIVNSNLAASGNDFGIDDISFSTTSTVPEPTSWALLTTGFALIGAAARRRRPALAV